MKREVPADSEMQPMAIENEDELEEGNYTPKKQAEDPMSIWLLQWYRELQDDKYKPVRIITFVSPVVLFVAFTLFISDSYSNLIAFGALLVSLSFIGVSIWMLCWILDKDTGTPAMKDISDPIREGSEGFFITQYGTIFKLAFLCSILLFLVYLNRTPAGTNSDID